MPTQEQFVKALWKFYQKALYPGLDWKFIEWVRDPLIADLCLSPEQFDNYLDKALEDSDEGDSEYDIEVGAEIGEARLKQTEGQVPVMFAGIPMTIISMKAKEKAYRYKPILKDPSKKPAKKAPKKPKTG